MDLSKLFILAMLTSTFTATRVNLQEPQPQPWTRTIKERASSGVIDFTTMPSCAADWCEKTDFDGLCEPVICPSTGEPDCIAKDCFCGLKFPMNCGWTLCSWGEWYNFEDWFADTCPDALKVDYSGLPSCIKSCLPNQFVIYGCITQGRSCLCQGQATFGCAIKCDEASNKTINTWFTDLCGMPVDVTTVTSDTEDEESGTPPSATHTGAVQRVRPKAPIHWYEILAIVIGSLTVLALGVWWILNIRLSRTMGRILPKPKST